MTQKDEKSSICDCHELIISNILSNSYSGYGFELFAINVLKDYLNAQGKGMYWKSEYSSFDAFLPNGIDDTSIPTDVEIKYIKTNKSGYWRAIEQICRKLNNSGVEQLLIILGTDFTEKSKEPLLEHPKRFTSIPVVIWDINDFKDRTKEYWDSNIHYLELPHKAIVEEAILQDKTQEQELKKRENLLVQLKQKYKDEDIVLVLGAGISIDAGIPLWYELIKKLLIEMINEKLRIKKKSFSKDEVNQLVQLAYSNMEDSPLAQMRYIKNAFDDSSYNQLIHSVLYENNPKVSTELLKAISEICTPRRRHIGVRSIITYNFDDLVERRLMNKGINYVSIVRENDISVIESLNIYHVHGYLPSRLNEIDNDTNIVFSEEDYHKVYRDAYSWSNIIQLNSFRENTCLFIGCSLNDPNLRRLLDVALRDGEKPRHYAILKKRRLKTKDNVEINPSVFKAYEIIDNSIRESYFWSLGINIIWINDYDEIPGILIDLLS